MDPYKVLGVNPGDDEETIKKAYRALVKKYHPDRYVNTPMADMATEKLKQINEAYDMITNKKTDTSGTGYGTGGFNGYGGYGGYGYGTGGARYRQSYSVSYDTVRMLIRMRRLDEAEEMLKKLDPNAEWNYLMGLLYINRGWYDQGKEYVKRAVNKDPTNQEYRQTLNSFDFRNRDFRDFKIEYTNRCGVLPCLCGSLFCSRCCYCCC